MGIWWYESPYANKQWGLVKKIHLWLHMGNCCMETGTPCMQTGIWPPTFAYGDFLFAYEVCLRMRINTYTLTRYRQFLQVNHAWYTWFIKWWSHLSERVLITCQCGDKDVYCITKEDACCCHFLWPHARLCIPFSVPLFSGPPLPGILFLKVFHSSFWGNHAPPSFPTQGQFLGNSLPWGISILFLFTCLAGKVAVMLVTCCPNSQMPAHLADISPSWQCKIDPDTPFLCLWLPTFTQFFFKYQSYVLRISL